MLKNNFKINTIIIFIGLFLIFLNLAINLGLNIKKHYLLKHIVETRGLEALPENDHKIIHISDVITTSSGVTDKEFLVNRPTLKLYRKVEVFDAQNGNELSWHESKNANSYGYISQIFDANKVNIGAYNFDNSWITNNIKDFSNIDIKDIAKTRKIILNKENLSQAISYNCTCQSSYCGSGAVKGIKGEEYKNISSLEKNNLYTGTSNSGWVCAPNNHLDIKSTNTLSSNTTHHYKILENYLFFGEKYYSPKKGDVRISYFELEQQIFTIIGVQKGNMIAPITLDGQDLLLITKGEKSAKQMLGTLITKRYGKSDIILFLGLILLVFGIVMLLPSLLRSTR